MSSRAAKTEAFTLKPGWLNRQWLRIQAEAKTWPTWMKEESGGDRMAGYVSDYIKETEAWERVPLSDGMSYREKLDNKWEAEQEREWHEREDESIPEWMDEERITAQAYEGEEA
jgi:hypothetical protein